MDSNDSNNTVLKILQLVSNKSCLKNCEYSFDDAAQLGQGYASAPFKAAIKGLNEKGEKEEIYLFLKVAPKEFMECMPLHRAYFKEINFYKKVLPKFNEYAMEVGAKVLFDGVPKCYLTNLENNNEYLVLEDLTRKGFSIVDRMVGLPEEKLKAVLVELGKLHAFSFALKQKKKEEFGKLVELFKDNIYDSYEYCIVRCFPDSQVVLSNLLERKGLSDLSEAHKKFLPEARDYMYGKLPKEDKFKVITHSDVWITNFMFKTDSSSTSAKLLDWQFCFYGHFIKDVTSVIHLNAEKDTLKKLNDFLNVYYQSLRSTLIELKAEVIPEDVFREEWRKHARHALALAPCIVRLKLCEAHEAPDCRNLNMARDFIARKDREDEFEECIVDLMRHFVDEKLI